MSSSIDGADFVCDDKAEKLSDCIRVDKSESHDDRRERKENSLEGRDDSQPTSSYIDNPKGHSTHSNQETVRTSITTNIGGVQILAGANTNPEHSDNRMELEDLVPKDKLSAILAAARIIALSRGERIRWHRRWLRRKDPTWRATETQANNGNWEGILAQTHQCLLNPSIGDNTLNMTTLSVESYLLTQAKAPEKHHLYEHYDAVNSVLDGYKELYEKKIDKQLATDYQTLAKNFSYNPSRVNMAQVRYDKFMQGKKFMISKSDQKLLDDFVKLNDAAQLKESAKKLHAFSKTFGALGKVLELVDLVNSFNHAQKSKDWRQFGAKISALGAGMLIGSIVSLGIVASSLPTAFVIAILGVVASHYFDENFWLGIQSKMSIYFEK